MDMKNLIMNILSYIYRGYLSKGDHIHECHFLNYHINLILSQKHFPVTNPSILIQPYHPSSP